MNISELARQMNVSTQELRDKLPALGFDIGARAIKVDDQVAQQIKDQWFELARRERLTEKFAKQREVAGVAEGASGTVAVVAKKEVAIPQTITVRDFAARLNLPVTNIIRILMKSGILATLNDRIDFETASIVAQDLGFVTTPEGIAIDVAEEAMLDRAKEVLDSEPKENLEPRPPIVVVMGHVDHGKCVKGDTQILLADGHLKSADMLWGQLSQGGKIEQSSDGNGEFVRLNQVISVASFDSEKRRMCTAPLEAMWRLPAPSELVEIALRSGDTVTTTPEHPFFVLNASGVIEQKPAGTLTDGAFVVVPQQVSLKPSLDVLAHSLVERFATTRNFVVLLHSERAAEFLERLKKENKQELMRQRLLSTQPYSKQFSFQRLRARDFVAVGRHWGYSDIELWQMIDRVKYATETRRASHRSPYMRLPQPQDDLRMLGYVFGAFAGDGDSVHAALHNMDTDIQEAYAEGVRTLFDLDATVHQYGTRCPYMITSGWTTFRRFLTDIIGFPKNDKSGSVTLPEFVQLYPELFRGFIAGWFDTDGYVSPFNWWIEITSKSRRLVEQCATLMLQDGVHSCITDKKGYATLRIANDPYIARFIDAYRPCCERKVMRMREAREHAGTSRIFDLTPLGGSATLADLSVVGGNETIPYLSKYETYQNLSRPFLRELLHHAQSNNVVAVREKLVTLASVSSGEISFVQIRGMRKVKSSDPYVYDFTVAKHHTFIGNRMVLHNTALLDKIRETNVMAGEAGGITQHIGAYQVVKKDRRITFIDTPGHEAFTVMRSRGAKVADIAILVVALDDGVQPQTKEAVDIIKAAKLPFVVALNKVDKSDANLDRVKGQLAEIGLNPEDWGGDTIMVPVSAKTGQGIDDLLDVVLLVADIHKEKIVANPERLALGTVIESHVEKGAGPVATVLVQTGTLWPGDILGIRGQFLGRVRKMTNWKGEMVEKARPSRPVQVLGFKVPAAVGDIVEVAKDLKELEVKKVKIRERNAAHDQVARREPTEAERQKFTVKIVLRTDVLGSLEALLGMLEKIDHPLVGIEVVKKGLGNITDTDIAQAEAARGVVYGFNVAVLPAAAELAREKNIEVKRFQVIYDLYDDVREHLEAILPKETVVTELGKLEVLAVFRKEKGATVVGGRVNAGKITVGAKLRVARAGQYIGEGSVAELQAGKQPAKEVRQGQECGMKALSKTKFEVGDILEAYTEETRVRELELAGEAKR